MLLAWSSVRIRHGSTQRRTHTDTEAFIILNTVVNVKETFNSCTNAGVCVLVLARAHACYKHACVCACLYVLACVHAWACIACALFQESWQSGSSYHLHSIFPVKCDPQLNLYKEYSRSHPQRRKNKTTSRRSEFTQSARLQYLMRKVKHSLGTSRFKKNLQFLKSP